MPDLKAGNLLKRTVLQPSHFILVACVEKKVIFSRGRCGPYSTELRATDRTQFLSHALS